MSKKKSAGYISGPVKAWFDRHAGKSFKNSKTMLRVFAENFHSDTRAAHRLYRLWKRGARTPGQNPSAASELRTLGKRTKNLVKGKKNPTRKQRARRKKVRGLLKQQVKRLLQKNPLPALLSALASGAESAVGGALGIEALKEVSGSKRRTMKKKPKKKKAIKRRIIRRNLDGFLDGSGTFHPIRGTEGYRGKLAGDVRKKKKSKKKGKRKKKNPRESQYVDSYLATTRGGRLVTPGTFLAGRLRGKAKRYGGGYQRALVRSLKRRGAQEVRSIRGGTAYNPRRRKQSGITHAVAVRGKIVDFGSKAAMQRKAQMLRSAGVKVKIGKRKRV